MREFVNKAETVGLYETAKGYSLYVKGECISSGIAKVKIDGLIKLKTDWEDLFSKILKKKNDGLSIIEKELIKLAGTGDFDEQDTNRDYVKTQIKGITVVESRHVENDTLDFEDDDDEYFDEDEMDLLKEIKHKDSFKVELGTWTTIDAPTGGDRVLTNAFNYLKERFEKIGGEVIVKMNEHDSGINYPSFEVNEPKNIDEDEERYDRWKDKANDIEEDYIKEFKDNL